MRYGAEGEFTVKHTTPMSKKKIVCNLSKQGYPTESGKNGHQCDGDPNFGMAPKPHRNPIGPGLLDCDQVCNAANHYKITGIRADERE